MIPHSWYRLAENGRELKRRCDGLNLVPLEQDVQSMIDAQRNVILPCDSPRLAKIWKVGGEVELLPRKGEGEGMS